MLYFGCGQCRNIDRTSENPRCPAFPDGIPFSIVAGDIYHTKPMLGQQNNVVFEPLPEAEYTLILENRDRFPNSTFLDPQDYEQIGFMSNGDAIIKVGLEDGLEEAALVVQASLEEDSREESVSIAPLYSLITMIPQDVQLIDFTQGA